MPTRFGMTLRTAEPGDADGLAALLGACGVLVPRERLAANLAALKAEAGTVLIAEDWGPPTGVIVLHWATRLAAPLKTAEASLLLVDPERRRNGVARLLLKAGAQAARAAGCGALALRTAGEPDPLRAFAVATGFSPAGDRFVRALRKQG